MLLLSRQSSIAAAAVAAPAAHSNYCTDGEHHRRYSSAIIDGVVELVCADDIVDTAFNDAFIDLRILLLTPDWTCARSSPSPPPLSPPPVKPPLPPSHGAELVDQPLPLTAEPLRRAESIEQPLPSSSVIKMDTVDKLSRNSSINSDRVGSQVYDITGSAKYPILLFAAVENKVKILGRSTQCSADS